MKHHIKNFVESSTVELCAGVHTTCGPLVTIIQRAGDLNFQFDMRPEQAREMADRLHDLAREMETAAKMAQLEAAA